MKTFWSYIQPKLAIAIFNSPTFIRSWWSWLLGLSFLKTISATLSDCLAWLMNCIGSIFFNIFFIPEKIYLKMKWYYILSSFSSSNTQFYKSQMFVCLLFEYFFQIKVLNYYQNTPKKANTYIKKKKKLKLGKSKFGIRKVLCLTSWMR